MRDHSKYSCVFLLLVVWVQIPSASAAPSAKLVQGSFDSPTDQLQFQQTLTEVVVQTGTPLESRHADRATYDFRAAPGETHGASSAKLSTPDQRPSGDGSSDDQFGYSVALSGDTALVGAVQGDGVAGINVGSAYVFIRSGTVWSLQSKLNASDAAVGDRFGAAVAISGDTALIGADGDDTAAGSDAGTAYVFTRNGTVWSQQAQLVATDGANGDQFGYSVTLAGDTALVGASAADTSAGANAGSAYVFVRSGAAWSQQSKLTAGDGLAGDRFGSSLALSGETALVGANLADTVAGSDAGSVYVFTRGGAIWNQQARLAANDAESTDEFGGSVALSGESALIGAAFDDLPAGADAGSAYVFTRSGNLWTQQAQLSPSAAQSGDLFGISVALSGDTALVGAFRDNARGDDSGAAYVFTRSGVTWTQQAQLAASDGAREDLLGFSVALSNESALVGAILDDTLISDTGSAYIFTRSGTAWGQQSKLTAVIEEVILRNGFE